MVRRELRVALLAGLVACSTSGAGARPSYDRDVLTAEEIRGTSVTTALAAVRLLRPHFLQTRGVSSTRNPVPSEPVVYVNGFRYGSPASLEQIRALDVLDIRMLSASDATTRYGSGHVGGVIEVRTQT